MNLINNLLSIKLKNRIKLIQKEIDNPIGHQKKILISHITYAKDTLFGKKHHFNRINNYSDFKKHVPITDYSEFKKYIDLAKQKNKNIIWPGITKWFAKSAGTSNNKSKFIPITDASLKNCHFKAGKDMLSMYLNQHPKSKILKGKSLMIGGSTNINKIDSYFFGDLSGIIIQNLPIWVQLKRLPNIKTALLEDWEKKIENIINETINQNITSISGVPSWTQIILDKLLKKTGATNLNDIWPNLELYMHGGISFKNYRNNFELYTNCNSLHFLEIYNASEGFFGIQNEPLKSDLLLLINHGVFYEFTPIKNGEEIINNTVPIEDVEIGQIYTMIISTNGGLWRYKMGDTIKFTSTNPYKIKIAGRTTSFINAFGEELIVSDANAAIQYACNQTNSIVNEYIAGPRFYDNKSGCHEWIIEFKKTPKNI
ncbi:GH3 auxin-responsive promoter family protein, partial [Flavobacteriales bacterium]|nr:GH3 auxin-responsive promoter family protein [Flavobacteriales bacterium]